MTGRIFYGIGRNGNLLQGPIDTQNGEIVHSLSDGTIRRFGRAAEYANWAINTAKPLEHPPSLSSALDAAGAYARTPSSVILEVTSFCNVGCSTCIADSTATRAGELTLSMIERRFDWLSRQVNGEALVPVMLSGGEPTQHPQFMAIATSPSFARLPQRYVITSGIDFAKREFAKAFAEQSPGTRIYLQYDSFVSDHLIRIRGRDLTELRTRTIENCEEFGISYTLICVVCRGVNDSIAVEIVERNLPRKHCEGITFQPIKMVGRNKFATEEHQMCTFDLIEDMQSALATSFAIELKPHPANPINWSIGSSSKEPFESERLYENTQGKRVAVIWHTDRSNYILESVSRNPICFLSDDRLVPLEVHYRSI